VQGYQQQSKPRPAANLVFLIDVSGSMEAVDKLPLLKNAFRLLVKQLTAEDRITMVVYAGASGLVLEPTPGDHQADILNALEHLSAGGSTHGSAGIKLAYAMAQQSFIKQGINRVILATDGDFNVGTVNHEALLNLVERNKRNDIALTTLGFGSGNYNDHLMEQLADHGDGNYAYIDNLSEARKVLVEQMDATLETIARDVKIQIEWNPDVVYEYRLIGYENRLLKREDFNNDKVDAGDIGAGHTVTALYEVTLNQSTDKRIQPLRYQSSFRRQENLNELAMINIRYKKPDQSKSQLISQIIERDQVKDDLSTASNDLRFAAAVAAYAEQLRGGDHLHEFGYDEILDLARSSRGKDEGGYRSAFLTLVALAQSLDS
jgi:Ca-activated chloride channel homolog